MEEKIIEIIEKIRPYLNMDGGDIEFIDYKDVAKLRRYLTEKGKILPRRQTGVCAYHQRSLTTAIKRARNIALIAPKAE